MRSGRRRSHPRRPPTPPYVRFRIRRFMIESGSAGEYPPATPAPCGRRRLSGTRGSCGWLRRSTRHRARWLPSATRAPPSILASSASWPGRRCACIDALVWPALVCVAVAQVPFNTGIIGVTAIAFAMTSAVRRTHRALRNNERYWFTTWRWGLSVVAMMSLALTMKLLMQ